MENDLKLLLTTDNMFAAQEIQAILEDAGIQSLHHSENPASSALNIFMGSQFSETVHITVKEADYSKAVEIVNNTNHRDLLAKE